MFRKSSMIAVMAISGIAAVAPAASIDLNYTGVVGGTSAAHARVGSTTYYAGHMNHIITASGASFNTFCIEIGEHATPGNATYEIVDLADAPNPGSDYGQAKADAVSAIVANAHAMGWIDNRLQAVSSNAGLNLARMGALQAAIWEALGYDFQLNSSATHSSLRDQYNLLMATSTFDGSMRMNGLRAVVAEGQQDMLYVVPLPGAGLAGLGMLGLCAGVRSVKRRR